MSEDTVDGRNPAPVDMVHIPLFTGYYTSQVVKDFFHQQYQLDAPRCFSGRKWPLFCNKAKVQVKRLHTIYKHNHEQSSPKSVFYGFIKRQLWWILRHVGDRNQESSVGNLFSGSQIASSITSRLSQNLKPMILETTTNNTT